MTLGPHIEAELASINGWPKTVAKYLRSHPQPNVQVLLNISRFLSGGENWILRFTTRNGRPPQVDQNAPESMWGIGNEVNLSNALDNLSRFQIMENSNVVLDKGCAQVRQVQEILARLADVLDPDPSLPEKWMLTYRDQVGEIPPQIYIPRSAILFLAK
jgi:hypothetical protein